MPSAKTRIKELEASLEAAEKRVSIMQSHLENRRALCARLVERAHELERSFWTWSGVEGDHRKSRERFISDFDRTSSTNSTTITYLEGVRTLTIIDRLGSTMVEPETEYLVHLERMIDRANSLAKSYVLLPFSQPDVVFDQNLSAIDIANKRLEEEDEINSLLPPIESLRAESQ